MLQYTYGSSHFLEFSGNGEKYFYNSGPNLRTASSLANNHQIRTEFYGITLTMGRNAKNLDNEEKTG